MASEPQTEKYFNDEDNTIILTYIDKKLTVLMIIDGRKSLSSIDDVSEADVDIIHSKIKESLIKHGYSPQTRTLILRAFLWI